MISKLSVVSLKDTLSDGSGMMWNLCKMFCFWTLEFQRLHSNARCWVTPWQPWLDWLWIMLAVPSAVDDILHHCCLVRVEITALHLTCMFVHSLQSNDIIAHSIHSASGKYSTCKSWANFSFAFSSTNTRPQQNNWQYHWRRVICSHPCWYLTERRRHSDEHNGDTVCKIGTRKL